MSMLPGQAYAVMVRSPHAHARIRAIDTSRAAGAPGVLAVLTGADAVADGLKPIPHRPIMGPPDMRCASASGRQIPRAAYAAAVR